MHMPSFRDGLWEAQQEAKDMTDQQLKDAVDSSNPDSKNLYLAGRGHGFRDALAARPPKGEL